MNVSFLGIIIDDTRNLSTWRKYLKDVSNMKEVFHVVKFELVQIDNVWHFEVAGRVLVNLALGDLLHFNQDCIYEVVRIKTYGRFFDKIEASMSAQILLKEYRVKNKGEGQFFPNLYEASKDFTTNNSDT